MAALKNKTFRAPDELFDALKRKSDELGLSESDVINKALRCFLGVHFESECENLSEFERLKNLVNTVIQANNLKTTLH